MVYAVLAIIGAIYISAFWRVYQVSNLRKDSKEGANMLRHMSNRTLAIVYLAIGALFCVFIALKVIWGV